MARSSNRATRWAWAATPAVICKADSSESAATQNGAHATGSTIWQCHQTLHQSQELDGRRGGLGASVADCFQRMQRTGRLTLWRAQVGFEPPPVTAVAVTVALHGSEHRRPILRCRLADEQGKTTSILHTSVGCQERCRLADINTHTGHSLTCTTRSSWANRPAKPFLRMCTGQWAQSASGDKTSRSRSSQPLGVVVQVGLIDITGHS